MVTVFRLDNDIIERAVRNTFRLDYDYQMTQQRDKTRKIKSVPTDVRWMVDFDLSNIPFEMAKRFEAFYDQVSREQQFFSLYDPARPYPLGCPLEAFDEDVFRNNLTFSNNLGFANSGGGVRASGLHFPGAEDITITNVRPDELVVKVGDYMEIDHLGVSMLYHCVQDAYSVADGAATVCIAPNLRSWVANDARINFIRPRGIFQFMQSGIGSERHSRRLADSSFQAREVYELVDFPHEVTFA